MQQNIWNKYLLGASQSTQWLFPGIVFLMACIDVGFTAEVIRPAYETD